MFIEKLKLIFEIVKGGKRDMQAIVDTYVILIVVKRRTIDQVLPHLRVLVLADLNAMGLDGYGNPIEP